MKFSLSILLEKLGLLFSDELGIDISSGKSSEIFKWFLASLLFGGRISETCAKNTYKALVRHNLLTPQSLADASISELLGIMAEGGYVRYDGIASRELQEVSKKMLADYGGDTNQVHQKAADSKDLEKRLQEFRGVGPVTTNIFLRELREIWEKADSELGELAALAAKHLKITDTKKFWEQNKLAGYDYRHFEVALTRLGKDYCRKGRCKFASISHNPT